MSKQQISIREYESICASEMGNDIPHLDRKDFEDLKAFIAANKAEDDNADALDFLKIGYSKRYGDIVTAQNYVGLIQLRSGHQIQILPKLALAEGEGDSDNNKKTIQVFAKMLRSLRKFQGKNFNFADLQTENCRDLYEVFISMYLLEVENLIKHGLRSDYLTLEDNLNFFKGKLVVKEHLRRNFVHKERFYVAYDEYHQNRVENRLIKSTLLKLQKKSNDFTNQKLIRQHLVHFEMVEESTDFRNDFEKVVIDRNTKDYEMLIRWSKVFLFDKSFTNFSGSENARALLFPMEKLFESYVAQELRKAAHRKNTGWAVSTQDRGHWLFDEPKKFALRPDIVVRSNDKRPIILDTKWKVLTEDPAQNYGISQADMYQMYAYSKKYDALTVWLLYPLNGTTKGPDRFLSHDGVTVKLFFVDLENNNLELLVDQMKSDLQQSGE